MTERLIAVDMDGTFLNSHQDFDRQYFLKLYPQMQQKHVTFVVASGNQDSQLRAFFPHTADSIWFVSDNGALIKRPDEEVMSSAKMDPAAYQHAIHFLDQLPDVHPIVSAVKSAYILDSEPTEFAEMTARYYYKLKTVKQWDDIDDTVLKLGMSVPDEQTAALVQALKDELAGELLPVSSGHGDIDLIIPHTHKANAVKRVADQLQIPMANVVAFGDGGNDVEMLKEAGQGYAMANAPAAIKAIANGVAPDHDENGVLKTIEKLLQDWQ
ncbi:Cof-type HAD-IIB family hydrolase [Pediococcus siamensis]|uniref:Cof-type HAD-IIB family hydrolase n=1 Tax=Pediococcus siamensis TaxID=381829 RepID=UPI0039A30DE4